MAFVDKVPILYAYYLYQVPTNMPGIPSNKATEDCLRETLKREGYNLSEPRHHGETGVDIVATMGNVAYHIEVIGFKQSASNRAMDFYQAFFRSISRLNENAKHCVIALPKRFGLGLPARAKQHHVAWRRIAQAFPELEIWLVDLANKTYGRTKWAAWIQ